MERMRLLYVALYTVLGIILYVSMYSNVKPEMLHLKLLDESPTNIYSPVTIEDKESTKDKQQQAKDEVEDIYSLNTEYAQNQVDLVSTIFDSIQDVNKEYDKKSDDALLDAEAVLKEKKTMLETKLPKDVVRSLGQDTLLNLFQANDKQLSTAKDSVVTVVHYLMKGRITVSDVQSKKEQAKSQLVYTNVSSDVKKAMYDVAEFSIIPNVVYNRSETSDRRQTAIQQVDPVIIKQGQILVEEGQLITRDIYRQLKLVGLLDNKNTIQPFLGLLLIVIVFLAMIMYYFQQLKKGTYRTLLMYVITVSVTIIIMKIVSLFQKIEFTDLGYLAPVALGALLVRILINERIAIATSFLLAGTGSIIFNTGTTTAFNGQIGLYFLISSVAGVLFLSEQHRRSRILQAGLFVSLINVVVILAILLIKNNGQLETINLGYYGIMAVVSGLVASILTIGLLPFFEAGFGILSTMKLIELSNPNHPLLRKILTEAPGTYHHSVMVANLSEAACEAIGASGLLARVGSYYHDIGKTRRPQYFIENQMNVSNPHDQLSPEVSRSIIIAHATDGAEILRRHKLPREFVDIAAQHHGTTLLKYFYYKALELDKDHVKEEDYRYPGPKAQTKEAAVIGIADSVEAAVRSMPNPTPEKIESLVRNIIKDRLQDEQFSECDITLKELETVATSLCETLNGIFHSRIEYPEFNKRGDQNK
ncbi:HD family phosphohydrolase [Priestia koreensis]|uniref:HD family phosphohydrolase n=1 Tax=Priestia koreensis TaxID=284581 RepID=UPI00206F518D|nr:HD family phosphohydrolase [Priestia koreensis]